MAERLAPDLAEQIGALARPVEEGTFKQLAPLTPTTGVIALAERPEIPSGHDPRR